MRIIHFSDIHGNFEKIDDFPMGDVLVFSGDYSCSGGDEGFEELLDEYKNFINKLKDNTYKYEQIIIVPGNHDFFIQKWEFEARDIARKANINLLINESFTFDNFIFFGSPNVPTINGKYVFEATKEELKEIYADIPIDVDVLITHCPPFWILDKTVDRIHIGSKSLVAAINKLENVSLNLFGHVHKSGVKTLGEITFINSAEVYTEI